MFLYILIGLVGGILAGMGMGGGTLLIPLLTSFLGVVQIQAQFINIFSFIVMSLFVVFIYVKEKMIDIFPAIIFSLVGLISSLFTAIWAKDVNSNIISIFFGIFLITLAIFQTFSLVLKKYKKNLSK